MPTAKLKNIVILILALVNVLLLCLVIPLGQERQRQQAEAAAQLETLFGQYGVRLDADELPDSRLLYTLEFSPDDDASLPAMRALLGDMVYIEEDSTRYVRTYRSEQGTCQISRGGSLEARLQGRAADTDLERAVSEELEAMGVAVASVSLPDRSSAGVYTVTAVQQILDVPVFSSALKFTFHNGVMTRAEGTVYFDAANLFRTDDLRCMSCADALVAFLGSRDNLGWVGASVVGVAQGYLRAETASAAGVRLVPGWRISTDTGSFWVNGISGEVSALET